MKGSPPRWLAALPLTTPSRFGQRAEHVLVRAFVAQTAAEALYERILLRLAWRDVVPFGAALLRPAQHRHRGQLRAVVADDHRGQAAARLPDTPTRAPLIEVSTTVASTSRVTSSTTHSIRNRRQSASASATKSRLYRWSAPCGTVLGASVPSARLPTAAPPHQQPLLAIQPPDALQDHRRALPPQQDRQPPVAEPAARIGQVARPLPQHRVAIIGALHIGRTGDPPRSAPSTTAEVLRYGCFLEGGRS